MGEHYTFHLHTEKQKRKYTEVLDKIFEHFECMIYTEFAINLYCYNNKWSFININVKMR